jgi:methyl-accepting chemotaxis protein
MHDIVASVQRVTSIMADIVEASSEQTAGIARVNGAIAQMDRDTQQNAQLVQDTASVAQSMQEQADTLAGVVSVFTIDAAAPKRAGRTPLRLPA